MLLKHQKTMEEMIEKFRKKFWRYKKAFSESKWAVSKNI
jgi:hypothetical protein